jgi:nicotinamide-nucleotide amidase
VSPAASNRPRSPNAEAVAEAAGSALALRGWRVAVAESCTGGLVLKLLTDIPGSSGWVTGGVVAYADSAKVALLGVARKDLQEHGAVSEPAARAMAEGVAARLDAEVGLAVTGIAGPGGAVPGKPVGTVWFGLALPHGTEAETIRFPGDRTAVREGAAVHALELLVRAAGNDDGPGGAR